MAAEPNDNDAIEEDTENGECFLVDKLSGYRLPLPCMHFVPTIAKRPKSDLLLLFVALLFGVVWPKPFPLQPVQYVFRK